MAIAIFQNSFASFLAFGLIFMTPPTVVRAEPTKTFEVQVRAISATKSDTDSMDPRVADLKDKLRRLPFSSFKLLSQTAEDVSLMDRETLHLSNGQTLCVRPVEYSGDQITMWMRWKGKDGMSILDTRVNFGLQEAMVAGIEGQNEDTGTILAVTVSPK